MRRTGWIDLTVVLVAAGLLGWFGRGTGGHAPLPTPSAIETSRTTGSTDVPTPAATVTAVWSPGADSVQHISIDGVVPGMTIEQTQQVLGPPTCHGPLNVKGGVGSYAEYGNSRLTWNGDPTLSFTPDGHVIAVIGNRIEGAHGVCRLGDRAAAAEAALGWPTRIEGESTQQATMFYNDSANVLTVTSYHDHISRALLSSVH
jgi:hypothetical protein